MNSRSQNSPQDGFPERYQVTPGVILHDLVKRGMLLTTMSREQFSRFASRPSGAMEGVQIPTPMHVQFGRNIDIKHPDLMLTSVSSDTVNNGARSDIFFKHISINRIIETDDVHGFFIEDTKGQYVHCEPLILKEDLEKMQREIESGISRLRSKVFTALVLVGSVLTAAYSMHSASENLEYSQNKIDISQSIDHINNERLKVFSMMQSLMELREDLGREFGEDEMQMHIERLEDLDQQQVGLREHEAAQLFLRSQKEELTPREQVRYQWLRRNGYATKMQPEAAEPIKEVLTIRGKEVELDVSFISSFSQNGEIKYKYELKHMRLYDKAVSDRVFPMLARLIIDHMKTNRPEVKSTQLLLESTGITDSNDDLQKTYRVIIRSVIGEPAHQ